MINGNGLTPSDAMRLAIGYYDQKLRWPVHWDQATWYRAVWLLPVRRVRAIDMPAAVGRIARTALTERGLSAPIAEVPGRRTRWRFIVDWSEADDRGIRQQRFDVLERVQAMGIRVPTRPALLPPTAASGGALRWLVAPGTGATLPSATTVLSAVLQQR